jgi:hypothetical protein
MYLLSLVGNVKVSLYVLIKTYPNDDLPKYYEYIKKIIQTLASNGYWRQNKL